MDVEDRELLELAAKAAGLEGARYEYGGQWMEVRHGFTEAVWAPTLEAYWNPRDHDGDALRLAGHIKCAIEWLDSGQVAARTPCGHLQLEHGNQQGLRRAIFCCAAAVGRKIRVAA